MPQKSHAESIRLLRLALVSAMIFPLAAFLYAAWLDYRDVEGNAQRQIERTAEVLNEHGLKVFEAVDRAIAEIAALVRDAPDDELRAQQAKLHEDLKRIVATSTELKSLWIFDRDGKPIANSIEYPVTPANFSDREYFSAHVLANVGLHVSPLIEPRPPYGGAAFFGVSKRRPSRDGAFNGVIQASVLPEYFENFYGKIAWEPGTYASLIREDGLLLARHPDLGRIAKLNQQGPLYQMMLRNPEQGRLTLVSAVDGQSRSVSYRKLLGYPVFVLAGLDTWAIRNQWLELMASQLVFAVPTTLALIAIITFALRRTQRLQEELERRLAAEDALRQSQRLEALGQLTGGVAHDFNNLLMVIEGSAAKLKSHHPESRDARAIAMIETAVTKGATLTRQLLAFARRQTLLPEVTDIGACITSLSGMLRQALTAQFDLRLAMPSRPVPVKLDRNEFEMAMLNLVLNARDAMPLGGTITIAVEELARGPEQAGPQVMISVRDTGEGIAEDIKDKVFEPFFTTKGPGKGTGLGLSQVYGFVRQSGGSVAIESTPGSGTTVSVVLPRSSEPLSNPEPAVSDERQVAPLNVLLVEDNSEVAEVASDYLVRCGCQVSQAATAEAAIEFLTHNDVDCVFSDVVMPGMTGLELARWVRTHRPDVGILLASGYSDKAAEAVAEGFTLLRKPYSLDTLRSAFADLSQTVIPKGCPTPAEVQGRQHAE